MKLKKAIKRVVALTTGVTMLGATLLGAMATADLNQYPSPLFIKDGNFNGLIVIGADASTQDMLGAMDVISSLQAVAVAGSVSLGTEASISTVGEAYKIEKSSNVLNIGEDIESIKSKLDEEQLPSILKDGTVRTSGGKEYEYEQEISFVGTDLELKHFSDKDYNDEEPSIGIPIDRNDPVLSYTIDFSKSLLVDNVQDRSIQILGVDYDIVEASTTKLELMQGAIVDTLEEGEQKIYTINDKEYEVQVIGIYDQNGEVKFRVNGEVTDSMTEGGVYETNDGTSVGVREVLPNEAGDITQDMVEFYLGAKKIVLEDGEELEMDDESIDDMDVSITQGSGDTISEITITWNAAEDLFITSESDVVMPGLEALKFYMSGFSSGSDEEVSITENGDSVKLSAPLDKYDVDLTILSGNNEAFTAIGESADRRIITNTCDEFTVTEDVEYFILSTASGDDSESHVLEVSKIDDEDGINVKDYDNNYVTENEKNEFDVGDMSVDVVSYNEDAQTATLKVTSSCDDSVLYTDGGLKISLPSDIGTVDGVLELTKKNTTTWELLDDSVEIIYTVAGNDFEVQNVPSGYTAIYYKDAEGYPGQQAILVSEVGNILPANDDWNKDHNVSDNYVHRTGAKLWAVPNGALNVNTIDWEQKDMFYFETDLITYTNTLVVDEYQFVITEENKDGTVGEGNSITVKTSIADDDVKVDFVSGATLIEDEDGNNVGYVEGPIGTKITEDDDNSYVELVYPSGETNGDVYIGSSISSTTIVEGTASEIVQSTKIEVGVAVLDTSLSEYTSQNLIVVGGPAVNRATANLLGKAYPTYGIESGIPENAGLIKLIEHANGNVAILIAGWEAEDSQKACRVLAEGYDNYPISGTEVIVTGTSITDLSIGVPAVVDNTNTTE